MTAARCATGTVPLVLGRIGELLPHHPAQQQSAWSMATATFALCQAASAFALSFIFAQSGESYRLLFTIGAAAMVIALAVDLIATATAARAPEPQSGSTRCAEPDGAPLTGENRRPHPSVHGSYRGREI